MGQLKKLSEVQDEKKKPVKAQPKTDKDGGIFTSKIVAIWNKIFRKNNG